MKAYLILDCSYLIYRAWHSTQHNEQLKNNEGKRTNAVYGFVNAIHTIHGVFKRKHKFEDIYVLPCFDSSSKNHERTSILDSYKSGRKMPEGLGHQFAMCKEACKTLGLETFIHDEYEADDIIVTFAKQLESVCDPDAGDKVFIVSCDKDMYQVVSETIWSYLPQKNTFVKPEDVLKRYGVYPKHMTMYQAMVGDSCDSIKGIGGIGPKSAPLIIKDKFPEDYPTFKEEIADNQTICKKLEKLKLKFSTLQEPYETNLLLVTLCTEVPMEMDPEALVPLKNDAFHSEDWKEMCSLTFVKPTKVAST